jgi:uncharacterized protein YecA (UPF0149 family)
MNNKIGRNDACICGSNKKYKKCCLSKELETTAEALDLSWYKLRKLEGEIIDNHLMPYLTNKLPNDAIELAINDFYPEDLPEQLDKKVLFERFFIPWVLFHWLADEDFKDLQFDSTKTVSQNYLTQHKATLTDAAIKFIAAMNQTYYSFYLIEDVVIDKCLVVKDIFLETQHKVKEKAGTHCLEKGKIVFGRILTLDNTSIFIGMAPYNIPFKYYRDLVDYKNWLITENDNQALNPQVLREYSAYDLIDYFFELITEYYNAPSTKLTNTDGDPIILSKSYFKISLTPEQVLEELLPLTLSDDPDIVLEHAKFDEEGEISKIHFPWLKEGNKKHKSWNNTVMGNITVEKERLILETNSEKRTEEGKRLLSKYLGNAVKFQQTLLQTPEQMMTERSNRSGDAAEQTQLHESPEVQEYLKQIAKAHWESWFDDKIPLLDNKTPRESVKTKKGRELLELLLLEYENNDLKQANLFQPDINYLKKELGLL